jgi:hypothetical protein
MLQETHIEQLNSRRQEILENCELDQIKLPSTDSMESDSAASSQQRVSFDYSKLSRSHQQVGPGLYCVDKLHTSDTCIVYLYPMFNLLPELLNVCFPWWKKKFQPEP